MFYLKGKVREFLIRNDCRYYQKLRRRSDGKIGVDSIKEETYQINLNNSIRNKLCVLIYKPKGFSQHKRSTAMLRYLAITCNSIIIEIYVDIIRVSHGFRRCQMLEYIAVKRNKICFFY
jgi:hypothetical protein